MPRFTVALTGGIGTGKTAVSNRLAALGVNVVDTDVIAREVVAPGQNALTAIAGYFGPDILAEDGSLRRAELRQRIFSEPENKRWLDNLLHPLIRARMWQRLRQATGPYDLAVIPLLVESGQHQDFDRILLVDAPEHLQVQRVMARDGVSREQAESALRNQSTRTARLAIADDVIVNDGDEASLDAAVAVVHTRYLALAAEKA